MDNIIVKILHIFAIVILSPIMIYLLFEFVFQFKQIIDNLFNQKK